LKMQLQQQQQQQQQQQLNHQHLNQNQMNQPTLIQMDRTCSLSSSPTTNLTLDTSVTNGQSLSSNAHVANNAMAAVVSNRVQPPPMPPPPSSGAAHMVGRIPANKHDNRKLFVGGLPNEGQWFYRSLDSCFVCGARVGY